MLDMINRLKQNNEYIRSIREKKKQWQALSGHEKHKAPAGKLLDKRMTPLELRAQEERIDAIRRRQRRQTAWSIALGLTFAGILIYLLFLKKW